jgi:group I intron endonuclease
LTTAGVYAIVNAVNGKRYIGSSKSVECRYRRHVNMLKNGRHHNPHLQHAWRKYGADKFTLVVLEVAGPDTDVRTREQFYLDRDRPEYNSSKNALSGARSHGADVRARISTSKSGRPNPHGRPSVRLCCTVCGGGYSVRATSKTRRTCSKKCMAASYGSDAVMVARLREMAAGRAGRPSPRNTRVTAHCGQCGAAFQVKRYRVSTGRVVCCSFRCAGLYNSQRRWATRRSRNCVSV